MCVNACVTCSHPRAMLLFKEHTGIHVRTLHSCPSATLTYTRVNQVSTVQSLTSLITVCSRMLSLLHVCVNKGRRQKIEIKVSCENIGLSVERSTTAVNCRPALTLRNGDVTSGAHLPTLLFGLSVCKTVSLESDKSSVYILPVR